MRNPKETGERSEGQILARLLLAGKVVLQPFGDNQRYDLVIDEDGTFVRIQCKTGRLREGAVRFNTCSNHGHRGKESRTYHGQADLFGVFCPDNNKVYLVPVKEMPGYEGALRTVPTKNGQTKGIRFASKYEFSPV
ncbi:group I intron-associated PD-(D/E)XK endonuclease [Deltaproteobacteria bacterium]|nr:group I intron-associated PD-(D/E)XK endonuclease [Deltaproteobacteria bacterium]